MLNPFPIQFLALFAYMILRLFVAVVLFYLAGSCLSRKSSKSFFKFLPFVKSDGGASYTTGIFLFLLGIMFALGVFTQYACIALGVYSLYKLTTSFTNKKRSRYQNLFYFLLLGISITLFITGAGVLAIDMPI